MKSKVKHYAVMLMGGMLTVVLLLPTAWSVQTYTQVGKSNKQATKTEQVILEITRKGAGMIFPTIKQVYFRLYENGHLELEVPPKFDPEAERPRFELSKREYKLNAKEVNEIISLAEKPDFLTAAEDYPALEHEVDAAMVTTMFYSSHGHKKKIVITNYRPNHPKASSYYPVSLRELLRRVVELRPKTKEEIQYGWGTIY